MKIRGKEKEEVGRDQKEDDERRNEDGSTGEKVMGPDGEGRGPELPQDAPTTGVKCARKRLLQEVP